MSVEENLLFIDALTKRGGLVFDPFAGTAKVGLAAHLLNRDFLGLEIKQAEVDRANDALNGDEYLRYRKHLDIEGNLLTDLLGAYY